MQTRVAALVQDVHGKLTESSSELETKARSKNPCTWNILLLKERIQGAPKKSKARRSETPIPDEPTSKLEHGDIIDCGSGRLSREFQR